MNPDIIVGIAGLVLGISYLIQSLSIPKAFIGNPWAPIYFPLSLGVLMTLCSIMLLFQALRQKRKELSLAPKPPGF